jgi:hypothetical protein
MHDEGQGRRHNGGEEHDGSADGLFDLLRRLVAPRRPAVLVMEPDGQLRCTSTPIPLIVKRKA